MVEPKNRLVGCATKKFIIFRTKQHPPSPLLLNTTVEYFNTSIHSRNVDSPDGGGEDDRLSSMGRVKKEERNAAAKRADQRRPTT